MRIWVYLSGVAEKPDKLQSQPMQHSCHGLQAQCMVGCCQLLLQALLQPLSV